MTYNYDATSFSSPVHYVRSDVNTHKDDFLNSLPEFAERSPTNHHNLDFSHSKGSGAGSPLINLNKSNITKLTNYDLGIGRLLIEDFPEDSIWRKIASCIPVIGFFVYRSNIASLNTKLVKCLNPSTSLRIIEIKKDYEKTVFVRNILTTACTIAALAHPVFSAFKISLGAISVFTCYVLTLQNKWRLDEINKAILTLKSSIEQT